MPRRKTPLITGEFYHIVCRGNNSSLIYKDKRDYERFLSTIKFYQYADNPMRLSYFLRHPMKDRSRILAEMELKKQKLVNFLSFCLMPNHLHFQLKQRIDGGVSNLMQSIGNSYSHYFNTRHNRTGGLFEGRFKAIRIETNEQLIHVNRYIHLNPYSSSVIKSIKDLFSYPYSSLSEYMNDAKKGLCEKETVLSSFGDPDDYRKFIINQADYQRSLDIIKHETLE